MRKLTNYEVDTSWMIFIKELISISFLVPTISYLAITKRYVWPSIKWVIFLLIGGLFCQFVGARLHFASFGLIGIVITIPLIQSSNMVFSSFIGRTFLGEKINKRCMTAMVVLLISMFFLILGPNPNSPIKNKPSLQQANASKTIVLETPSELLLEPTPLKESPDSFLTKHRILLGGLGCLIAGLAYAIHIVFMRTTGESQQMPITLMMLEITGIGALIFGFETWQAHGWDGFIRNIPHGAWPWVFAAGISNMVAFYFQIAGLRYTIVARAQMIAAAQIVVTIIIGTIYFAEPTNTLVWLGVALTIVGIFLVSSPAKEELATAKNLTTPS